MVVSLWEPHTSCLVVLFAQLLWPGQPSFKLTVALWQPTHLEGLRVRSSSSPFASAFPPTENSMRELPIYNVSLLRASLRQDSRQSCWTKKQRWNSLTNAPLKAWKPQSPHNLPRGICTALFSEPVGRESFPQQYFKCLKKMSSIGWVTWCAQLLKTALKSSLFIAKDTRDSEKKLK